MKTYVDVLHERRRILQNPYAFIDELAELEAIRNDRIRLENPYAHDDQVSKRVQRVQRFDAIAEKQVGAQSPVRSRRYSGAEIEQLVRDIQLDLWNRRVDLLGESQVNPIALLDPAIPLRLRNYEVAKADSLGQFASPEGVFEVAGSIDNNRHVVQISTQFSRSVRTFTLAHELGHAVLHGEMVNLHRDRPLDGSVAAQEPVEREANRFATLFLMPAKLVEKLFYERFGGSRVRVDEHALLGPKFPRGGNVHRGVSRRLALMTNYANAHFKSLAESFYVSSEAMAIRLEELELFELSGNLPGATG